MFFFNSCTVTFKIFADETYGELFNFFIEGFKIEIMLRRVQVFNCVLQLKPNLTVKAEAKY